MITTKTLVGQLQKKYKAVFVDEFQDTDKLQYEIFHTTFGNRTKYFVLHRRSQAIYLCMEKGRHLHLL